MREASTVAVVQPNIPEHIKLDPVAGRDSTYASLARLMPGVTPGAADLVVMPEVTLNVFAAAEPPGGRLTPIQGYARATGAPVLFGAIGHEGDLRGSYSYFNSAFLMGPDGLADYRYDKRFLVPFVERVPFVPSAWFGGLQYFGGFSVGQGWPLAEVGGVSYGVLVCYESTYAEGSRAFRRAGADVLVNITNDAWYGREPLYARTTALWQHPAHMVMRAIENRVGVARAANTGISLFIDPVGRVHDSTRLFEADVRVGTVLTTDITTFYTRFGDLLGNGAAIAALVLLVASFRLGRSLDPAPPRV
jgi:apolipoprotein N-acyltransferase